MADTINVGAKDNEGKYIPTKKALTDALKRDPASVTFEPTAAFGNQQAFKGDEIPDGSDLSVCGPDPHNSRKWWATVTPNGSKGLRVT